MRNIQKRRNKRNRKNMENHKNTTNADPKKSKNQNIPTNYISPELSEWPNLFNKGL